MNILLLLAGILVVAVTLLDALWTTLWPEGHAGPIVNWATFGIHGLFKRLAGGARRRASGARVNHRLLSVEGPVTLVAGVLLWVALLWTGWTLIFSAGPAAIVGSHSHAPANGAERIYFTGYVLFTLGNGDFAPLGAGWQIATAVASLTGLLLISLTVTYLLSALGAVVTKRAFASQVIALGASPADFVCHAWDGRGFGALDLQLLSLAEQLGRVTQQHRAYPMLHYYHSTEERTAVPAAVAVLDDALTLLSFGVAPDCRPAPTPLRVTRETVRGYLDTVHQAHVGPADVPPAPPDLENLRRAAIPTVSEDAFAAAVGELGERRRLLRGILESEARQWPSGRS